MRQVSVQGSHPCALAASTQSLGLRPFVCTVVTRASRAAMLSLARMVTSRAIWGLASSVVNGVVRAAIVGQTVPDATGKPCVAMIAKASAVPEASDESDS